MRRRPRGPAFLVIAALVGGCTTSNAARLANPAAVGCRESLRDAVTLMLVGQGEKDNVAEQVARSGADTLADVDLGPHPFKLSSPSGIDYAFYFEDEGQRCLLHLVAKQGAGLQFADTLTFLATRPLAGCRCER
jgi:hypothetical protein